jgi:riboflavin biosynthesis pyrimidine reductase
MFNVREGQLWLTLFARGGLVDEIVIFRAPEFEGRAPYFSVPNQFMLVSKVRSGRDTKEHYVLRNN